MVLSFTALTKQNQFRSFNCQLSELETALDVLNTISQQGDTLLNVWIKDEDTCIELPPNIFDGESFSKPLQDLKKQWEAVLSQPVRAESLNFHWRMEMANRQLQIYSRRIDHYAQLIDQFRQLRQCIEKSAYSESSKVLLMGRYDTLISRSLQYIDWAKTRKRLTQQKLDQLVC